MGSKWFCRALFLLMPFVWAIPSYILGLWFLEEGFFILIAAFFIMHGIICFLFARAMFIEGDLK